MIQWVVKISQGLFLGTMIVGCLQTRGQLSGGAPPADRQNAQIDNRFYEIDKDFRELYGKIENIENQMSQVSERTSSSVNEPSEASKEVIERLEARIATLEEALLALDKKVSSGKSANSKRPKIGGSIAIYLRGDRLYREGKYAKAIEVFQKYRRRYPVGKMYPLTTMRIAESFEKLNMEEDAKPFYQEVVNKYPVSDVAKKASEKLRLLQ